MPAPHDLLGKTFGRLTVTEQAERPEQPGRHWKCLCSCGTEVTVRGGSLSSGHTESCGCAVKERVATLHTFQRNVFKHGGARHNQQAKEYGSWRMMHRRCYLDDGSASFARYGGRGITVCKAWHDYLTFLRDMGPCPKGLTLERLDSDGNYEPANCVWDNRKVQALNRSSNVLIDYQNRRHPLGAWCDELGLRYQEAYYRHVRCGWPFEEVVKFLKPESK